MLVSSNVCLLIVRCFGRYRNVVVGLCGLGIEKLVRCEGGVYECVGYGSLCL